MQRPESLRDEIPFKEKEPNEEKRTLVPEEEEKLQRIIEDMTKTPQQNKSEQTDEQETSADTNTDIPEHKETKNSKREENETTEEKAQTTPESGEMTEETLRKLSDEAKEKVPKWNQLLDKYYVRVEPEFLIELTEKAAEYHDTNVKALAREADIPYDSLRKRQLETGKIRVQYLKTLTETLEKHESGIDSNDIEEHITAKFAGPHSLMSLEDVELARILYQDYNLSHPEISRFLNYHPETIRKQLIKHGIPSRPREIKRFYPSAEKPTNVFDIYPREYLAQTKSPHHFTKLEETIEKPEPPHRKDTTHDRKAYKLTLKWHELPSNYKIRPLDKLKNRIAEEIEEKIREAGGITKLERTTGIKNTTLYRLVQGKHVSIDNFKPVLNELNINPESIDDENVSIVAASKVIHRTREELRELVSRITSPTVDMSYHHWFEAPDTYDVRIPQNLLDDLCRIIELKYTNLTIFTRKNKLHKDFFLERYRQQYPNIRVRVLKGILNGLDLKHETIDETGFEVYGVGNLLQRYGQPSPKTYELTDLIPRFPETEARPFEITEATAEEMGIHLGDGMMNIYTRTDEKKIYLIKISGDVIEDKPYYDYWVKPLEYAAYGKQVEPSLLKRNEYGISYSSKEILQFKSELGLPLGRKLKLTIPQEIKRDKELLRRCLRGIFDTDGGFSFLTQRDETPSHPRIELGSPNREFMQEISNHLFLFGVKNQLYQKSTEQWTVTIDGREAIEKFLEEISFKNPRHTTKWLIYEKHGYCPKRTNLIERILILQGILNPKRLLQRETTRNLNTSQTEKKQ